MAVYWIKETVDITVKFYNNTNIIKTFLKRENKKKGAIMQVGDTVKVVSSNTVEGYFGEIVKIDNSRKKHTIGVDFGEAVDGGHDCDGYGEEEQCRWLSPKQVCVVSNTASRTVVNSTNQKGGTVLKKLSTFLKRTLNTSAKAQYRAGFLEVVNNELVPTRRGMDELARYLMVDDKSVSAAMGDIAQAVVDEAEEEEKKNK